MAHTQLSTASARTLAWPAWLKPSLPAWADQLDFVGPRAATALWAWALLAAGVVATMAVADRHAEMEQLHADGEAQIKRLARADRQVWLERALQAEPAASAASLPEAPPLQGQALASAATMGLLLSYPWSEALTQIESQASQRRVVMLSMSADTASLADASKPRAPAWRLQAAVLNDASALAWATSLPQGQLLSREPLNQPFTGAAGSYALRASVQGAWPVGQATVPDHGAQP